MVFTSSGGSNPFSPPLTIQEPHCGAVPQRSEIGTSEARNSGFIGLPPCCPVPVKMSYWPDSIVADAMPCSTGLLTTSMPSSCQ